MLILFFVLVFLCFVFFLIWWCRLFILILNCFRIVLMMLDEVNVRSRCLVLILLCLNFLVFCVVFCSSLLFCLFSWLVMVCLSLCCDLCCGVCLLIVVLMIVLLLLFIELSVLFCSGLLLKRLLKLFLLKNLLRRECCLNRDLSGEVLCFDWCVILL